MYEIQEHFYRALPVSRFCLCPGTNGKIVSSTLLAPVLLYNGVERLWYWVFHNFPKKYY